MKQRYRTMGSWMVYLALIVGTSPPVWAGGTTEFSRGDATVDGSIDIADVVFTLNYLIGGNDLPCLDAADVNDDGSVNLGDPIFLLAVMFGSDPPTVPAPFLTCGFDPTPDGLDCDTFVACP